MVSIISDAGGTFFLVPLMIMVLIAMSAMTHMLGTEITSAQSN